MKQSASQTVPVVLDKDVLNRIAAIEKDVVALKIAIFKKTVSKRKNLLKLRGILKGEEITEKDVSVAKTSLYARGGI